MSDLVKINNDGHFISVLVMTVDVTGALGGS